MVDVLNSSSSGISWNLSFSRDLYDWEVDSLASLTLSLKEVFLSFDFLNMRVWVLESSGVFTSKSLFLSSFKNLETVSSPKNHSFLLNGGP